MPGSPDDLLQTERASAPGSLPETAQAEARNDQLAQYEGGAADRNGRAERPEPDGRRQQQPAAEQQHAGGEQPEGRIDQPAAGPGTAEMREPQQGRRVQQEVARCQIDELS